MSLLFVVDFSGVLYSNIYVVITYSLIFLSLKLSLLNKQARKIGITLSNLHEIRQKIDLREVRKTVQLVGIQAKKKENKFCDLHKAPKYFSETMFVIGSFFFSG